MSEPRYTVTVDETTYDVTVEIATSVGEGGGVTDHGLLSGLGDNDHPQYATVAAVAAGYQPLEADLTAIAALSTTAYGRAFLVLADQAALMVLVAAASDTTAGKVELATSAETTAGSSSTLATTPAGVKAAIDAAVAALLDSAPGALDTLNELAAALGDDPNFAATITTALAGKQPLNSNLTSIAALTTTVYGRALLELADAAAGRTALGLVIGTHVQAYSAVLAATTASFTSADETKLDGIEAGADVTDAANVDAAGAVMNSDVDAKGDLLVATADNTLARLPVGSNDQVLTADSSQASGVKWAPASGGGTAPATRPSVTAYTDAYGWPGGILIATATTKGLTANRLYLCPFSVPTAITLTAMGIRVTSAGAGGTVIRLGIYATTGQLAAGGARMVDAGTVAADSTGTKTITGLSTSLPAGTYFLAVVSDGTPTVVRDNVSPFTGSPLDRNQASGDPRTDYWYNAIGSAGALPSTCPALTAVSNEDNANIQIAHLKWS